MSPRANFGCSHCSKIHGDPDFKIPNLPLDAKFCPNCGHRRGFKRLFDSVQVSTRGHRVARFIDKRMRPAFDAKAAKDSSAKQFAQDGAVALDKAWEQAPAAAREAAVAANGGQRPPAGISVQHIPAAAALSSIDPSARADSRTYTYPMIQRRVIPLWQK